MSKIKHVFIVGCPRSGSTWITFLLAQHPAVATFQHAKLFDYLQFMQRWYYRKAGGSFIVRPGVEQMTERVPSGEEDNTIRLRQVLPENDYYILLHELASRILARVASVDSAVQVVVDKTPENGHLAEFILKVLPEAYFIHVVRDPRSVFCSHRSASRSWAPWEFPTQPVDGAMFWKQEVEQALQIESMTDRYRVIRYEDMKQDSASVLAKLLDWLELSHDPGFCKKAEEICSKDQMRELKVLPENFVRKTPEGGWREELQSSEVRILEYLAGDLMQKLGYEFSQPTSRRKPFRVCWQRASDAALMFLEKKTRRLTQRLLWSWIGRRLEWNDP